MIPPYLRCLLTVTTALQIAGVQACIPCGCGCGGRCGHVVQVVSSLISSDVPTSPPTPDVMPTLSTSITASISSESLVSSTISSSSTTTPGPTPIAGAWLYLADDQDYNTIPSEWSAINFANVDALFIGPAGIQVDGTFGLYSSNTTGPLATRFRWALETARAQNPSIKIALSQWWGEGSQTWGLPLLSLMQEGTNSSRPGAVAAYAASVRAFFQDWASVAGGLDGFDVDYEDNNAIPVAPDVFKQVRQELNTLATITGRTTPFWVTASASETEFLDEAVPAITYINMQTYAGGQWLTPEDFLRIGYRKDQLLYGICPETNCEGPTVQEAEGMYTNYSMAGIHVWRLNSDNYAQEGKVQEQIYDFLHG